MGRDPLTGEPVELATAEEWARCIRDADAVWQLARGLDASGEPRRGEPSPGTILRRARVSREDFDARIAWAVARVQHVLDVELGRKSATPEREEASDADF